MSINGTMMQYFHWYYGSENERDLWEKVKNESKRLSDLGITGLWLPPAFKASGGDNDVGYGVYDLYDLGEFDQKGSIKTKYGSKDEYLEAIEEAHKYNIQIYADVVFNHKAGADQTEWVKAGRVYYDNRNFFYGEETWIEAWTQFTFPGRGNKYSDFKWNYKHFDGVDWAQNLNESSIFKFLSRGKDWDGIVSGQYGNYDYLMFSDLDMNHPEVRTELARWAKWFINTTNVDGFRIDAVKHIQYSFFRDWLAYIRKEFPNKNLFAVGEYWSSNLGDLLYYLENTNYSMSLFDAPLQNNFYRASREYGFDMRYIFSNSLVDSNPMNAVTLVDNHDTQPFQSLERWVDYWFKPLAYSLILLKEGGYPCIFYPDLYGATYTEYKDGTPYEVTLIPVQGIEKLIEARKKYAYGIERNYFDHPNTVGFTREGTNEFPNSGAAVLLTTGAEGSKWMEVGSKHAGKTFVDYLGNRLDSILINQDGWGEFKVNAGSVSVWVPE